MLRQGSSAGRHTTPEWDADPNESLLYHQHNEDDKLFSRALARTRWGHSCPVPGAEEGCGKVTHTTMSPGNNYCFPFSFPIMLCFISFSYLMVLYNTMLNRNGKNWDLSTSCLVPCVWHFFSRIGTFFASPALSWKGVVFVISVLCLDCNNHIPCSRWVQCFPENVRKLFSGMPRHLSSWGNLTAGRKGTML